ncbi:hypothetical protein BH23VER1_BH23VER1_24690 [soil metagenome]
MPRTPGGAAGDRVGGYRLLKRLGEGGFGVVWLAEEDPPLRRRVALKVIKLGMDTREVVARFEQERQALALMDHPGIARVLGAGATPGGRPFFAMELVTGRRITEHCDAENLPTAARLRLFIDVCSAVQHAHQKGIIHRDLKPSNILVSCQGGHAVPKVIDFGVAKATAQGGLTDRSFFTRWQQPVGTPLYMAPEQAESGGTDIDTRCDIYALGMLLYELLVGSPPYDPDQLARLGQEEARRILREQPPPRPSAKVTTLGAKALREVATRHGADGARLLKALRGDLDWIVMKAVEKPRVRRYATASEFAEDVRRHLDGAPVLARPPSALYRIGRIARRHRGGFAAAFSVAACLLLGTVAIGWNAVSANQREREAADALAALRENAPAFSFEARILAAEGRFEEAIEKLDLAISLQPDEPAYRLARGDLLQSLLRFGEAAEAYRAVLELERDHSAALAGLKISEDLADGVPTDGRFSQQGLAALLDLMRAQRRAPEQWLPVARLVGLEGGAHREMLLRHLRALPGAPDPAWEDRVQVSAEGGLLVNLSSIDVRALDAIGGFPVVSLDLSHVPIADLPPLAHLPLRSLSLAGTGITDLSVLGGLRLESLNLAGNPCHDLTALRGMPLEALDIASCPVADLAPLAGMRLRSLDASGAPVADFSPLRTQPLAELRLADSEVDDLGFLQDMPVERLDLRGCLSVADFAPLGTLASLSHLRLPDGLAGLADDAIDSLGCLRDHPSLGWVGTTSDAEEWDDEGIDEFWHRFDGSRETRAFLDSLDGCTPQLTQNWTWNVSFRNSASPPLERLTEVPVSHLHLHGCTSVNLALLKDLPLDLLDLCYLKVNDLLPLQSLPLRYIGFNHVAGEVDLAPLAGIHTLEMIRLPEHADNADALLDLPQLRPGMRRELLKQIAARTESLARSGDYGRAAEALGRLPETTRRIRIDSLRHWINGDRWTQFAASTLATGHLDDYRKICQEVVELADLGKDPGPKLAAKIALLHPDSGVSPAKIREFQATSHPETVGTVVECFWKFAEGLRRYRTGDPGGALEILSFDVPEVYPQAHASMVVVRAMAYHGAGQKSLALEDLGLARELVLPQWPAPELTVDLWHDWLVAFLLLQEAEALLGTGG